MSRLVYIVYDPRGNMIGASCVSEDAAWTEAFGDMPPLHPESDYICETITLPSPHDAALLKLATEMFASVREQLPRGN